MSEREMQERGLKVINGSDIQKEIDNDPELFKIDSIEENSRLHVLKQWKPQTDNYVSGIKSSLEKLLSMDKAKVKLDANPNENFFENLKGISREEFLKEHKNNQRQADNCLKHFGKYYSKQEIASIFIDKTNIDIIDIHTFFSEDAISFDYQDNSGFSIKRKINMRYMTVDNKHYEVPKDYQNNNYYKNIMLRQLSLYKALNLKKIELHANIDVGCYAWAKYGFDFINNETRKRVIKLLANKIGYRYATKYKKLDGDLKYQIADLITENLEKTITNAHSLVTTYRYIEYESEIYDVKELLIDGLRSIDWQGELDLTNPEAVKILTDYCNKAEKEKA